MGVGDEVARVIARLGLAVTIHPNPWPSGSPDRERLFTRAGARAADLQRSTGLVRSIGIDPAWVSRSGIVVYDPHGTARALGEIARAVDGLGVAVAVENWKINPEHEEFRRLARELEGAELGLILDLGHLHVMTDDVVGAAGEAPLPVREVHVSDNAGSSDDHLPLGRGTLPIGDIARVLTKGGFEGVWTLETRARYNFAQCTIRDARARKTLLDSRERLARAVSAAAIPGA